MLDDFYNRKMQLAQLMSQRSPVFKPNVLPNQNMQTEQALQQVNKQNEQNYISTEKQDLAKALAGKDFSNATDLWGVAANALEGYTKGRAQYEAKEEQKKNRELENSYKQQLAEALSGNKANISELAKNPLVKTSDLVDFYKAQSSGGFGNSLTGKLAQDNYNKFIASGMSPEMAKSAAIQQAMNQAGVAAGNTVPGNFGSAPQPTAQPAMTPPPLPPGDLLGDQDLPNIPDNGMVPTPTVVPTGAPQPPMTGVPFLDKINIQNWADINKEKAKSNIDLQKERQKKSDAAIGPLRNLEIMKNALEQGLETGLDRAFANDPVVYGVNDFVFGTSKQSKNQKSLFDDYSRAASSLAAENLSLFGGSDTERELLISLKTVGDVKNPTFSTKNAVEQGIEAAKLHRLIPTIHEQYDRQYGSMPNPPLSRDQYVDQILAPKWKEITSKLKVPNEMPEGARQAPDGNYYVERDGKFYRIEL